VKLTSKSVLYEHFPLFYPEKEFIPSRCQISVSLFPLKGSFLVYTHFDVPERLENLHKTSLAKCTWSSLVSSYHNIIPSPLYVSAFLRWISKSSSENFSISKYNGIIDPLFNGNIFCDVRFNSSNSPNIMTYVLHIEVHSCIEIPKLSNVLLSIPIQEKINKDEEENYFVYGN